MISQEQSKKTFYSYNNKVYSQEDFENLKQKEYLAYSQIVDYGVYINQIFVSSENRNDSIIKTVTLTCQFGHSALERHHKRGLFSLIGTKFPYKDFKDNNYVAFDEKKYKGKPAMICLWFPFAKTQVEQMKFLNEIAVEYAGKVNFISITSENKIKVDKFLKKKDFYFTPAILAKEMLAKLGAKDYPIIFVNKEGIIEQVELGISHSMDSKGRMTINDTKDFFNIINSLL